MADFGEFNMLGATVAIIAGLAMSIMVGGGLMGWGGIDLGTRVAISVVSFPIAYFITVAMMD